MRQQLQRLHEARRKASGFTLIELLIVIVILGVLAAVVVIAVGAFQDRGQEAACKSDVKSVETAVEAYRATTGDYPTAAEGGHDGLDALIPDYVRELPNLQADAPDRPYYITYNSADGHVDGYYIGGDDAGTSCVDGQPLQP